MTRTRTGNVNTRDAAVARIRVLWPEIPASSVPPIEREIDVLLCARVHRQTFCSIPPVRNIRSSLERALSLKCAGSRGWQSLLPARETVLAALCVAEDGQLGSSIGQLLRAVGAEYLTVPRCRAPSPSQEEGELGSPSGTPGVMTPGSTPRNSADLPASQAPPAGAAPTSMYPGSIQHIRMNAVTVRGYVNRAVPLPRLPANAPPYEQLEAVTEYLDDRVEATGDAAVALHNILVDASDDSLRGMRRDHTRAVLALREEHQMEIARVDDRLSSMRGEIARLAQRVESLERCLGYNGARANGGIRDHGAHRNGSYELGEGSGYWEAMLEGGNQVPGYGDVSDQTLKAGTGLGTEGQMDPAFWMSTDVMPTEPMAVDSTLEEFQATGGSCGYPSAGPSPP